MSKENLHLPKTNFSMKANLAQKEPDILKQWEQNKTFKKIRENSKGKKNLYFMMDLHMQMDIFIWVQRFIKF